MLLFLYFLLVGAFSMYFFDSAEVKKRSLIFSIFYFFYSLFFLLVWYDKNILGFQAVYSSSFIYSYGITFTIGYDGLSLFFIILTTFIMPLVILST
jgi:NADH-quinone oxidoreductase subunit M